MHGFTYMGHTIACAAALAVLNTIVEDGLLENVLKQGDYLISQLQQHLRSHPNVGDIRGRGLLVGIEFVADRASKKALNPNYSFHATLKTRMPTKRAALLSGWRNNRWTSWRSRTARTALHCG